MQEIRFHGRGGQGAVIGSEVLAQAFFKEDKFVQAFPFFGVERRGAPVTAFCRVDDSTIHLRNQIYNPDYVIVLNASLVESADIVTGLKSNGTVLINTNQSSGHYHRVLGNGFKVFTVDASTIATGNCLGSKANPIVNTAICGAFAGASGLVSIEAVEAAIGEYVPGKKRNNQRAAREAYEAVVHLNLEEKK
jgi:pyruvate ferredoxin oxidoreductase gamma subunit/2-oxoisovalerate ferredoxin oxidoreductase gamma subunit